MAQQLESGRVCGKKSAECAAQPERVIPPEKAAQSDRAAQPGKFVFPGTLKLHVQRLKKGQQQDEYRKLFNLRYHVYCHEAHFLDPENYPSQQEMDEFDAVSEHFLATNAGNNHEMVGTVRLAMWSEQLFFPTSAYFGNLIDELDRLKFPLKSTAEISRLCISKLYRKRAIDGLLGIEGYTEQRDPRREYPQIILQLLKSMYQASKHELGITHWIATFEDCLLRMLGRYGFRMERISAEEIDYYGKVKIYGASIEYMENELKASNPKLYDFICGED